MDRVSAGSWVWIIVSNSSQWAQTSPLHEFFSSTDFRVHLPLPFPTCTYPSRVCQRVRMEGIFYVFLSIQFLIEDSYAHHGRCHAEEKIPDRSFGANLIFFLDTQFLLGGKPNPIRRCSNHLRIRRKRCGEADLFFRQSPASSCSREVRKSRSCGSAGGRNKSWPDAHIVAVVRRGGHRAGVGPGTCGAANRPAGRPMPDSDGRDHGGLV